MSLVDKLQNGKPKKIHVSEIRENLKNHYSLDSEEIKAIALSIKNHGQLENGIVYEEDLRDGKVYTLVSGAKRYNAICLLQKEHQHDGYMKVDIIDKPKNQLMEDDILNDANTYRRLSTEEMYARILHKENVYEDLKQKGEIDKGVHKRDFVAATLGVTGRYISKIKSQFEKELQKEENKKPLKSNKNYLKKVSIEINEKYGYKTTLTDRTITFRCKNTEELNQLFKQLKIDVELQEEVDK